MSPSVRVPSTRASRSSRRNPSLILGLTGGILLMLVLLTACGTQPTAASAGVPTVSPTVAPPLTATSEPTLAPEQLERGRTLLVTQGCVGCHTIDRFPEAVGKIGPDLSHISSEAITIIESATYKESGGMTTTVKEYLRESITDPSRFVAPTCPLSACTDNLMPKDFQTRLKEDEIAALVDLLLSLK